MGGGIMNIDLPITNLKAHYSSSSSNSNPNLKLPVSASYYASPTNPCSCCSKTCKDLVALEANEDITPTGSFSTSVFRPAPSESEIELAISLLKNFIDAVSSSQGEESKWVVQMLNGPTSRLLMSFGLRRVYEAFQLLQSDPSVKRLVVSLASDKALWDAIMNNELVRKFGEPQSSAESGSRKSTSEEPELTARILQWIWEIVKAKVIELVEKFQSLVDEMFQHGEIEKQSHPGDNKEQLKDKVRSSLLLSVVILLIVVVARANRV